MVIGVMQLLVHPRMILGDSLGIIRGLSGFLGGVMVSWFCLNKVSILIREKMKLEKIIGRTGGGGLEG